MPDANVDCLTLLCAPLVYLPICLPRPFSVARGLSSSASRVLTGCMLFFARSAFTAQNVNNPYCIYLLHCQPCGGSSRRSEAGGVGRTYEGHLLTVGPVFASGSFSALCGASLGVLYRPSGLVGRPWRNSIQTILGQLDRENFLLCQSLRRFLFFCFFFGGG
ncbi:uncharacterized protein EV420DRAFT_1540487 [Desarmillaria tabescens]|uniref:Uncharacterized protein n=1 Tax=Armillaria tabescens TaxID=1929756 RepID=A0AA39KF19_ARMTA|nr:uncharacterized protein EV420DRAFT_1540487 [Desarmillaria tabescens]KAK0458775.1 hypothetical protein EV420DRAFT_1540487 [Desarmillaria tabescens]